MRDASASPDARRSSLQAMAWSGLNEKQVPAELDHGAGSGARRATGRTPSWCHCRGGRTRPAARRGPGQVQLSPALLADRRRRQESRRASLERTGRGARRPGQSRSKASSHSCWPSFRGQRPLPAARRPPTSWRGPSSRPEQLDQLAEPLRSAGPVEVDRLLAAFEQSSDESLGLEAAERPRQARRPFRACGPTRSRPTWRNTGRRPERGRDSAGQDQRRCRQAESPARAALAHPHRGRHPPRPARLPQ